MACAVVITPTSDATDFTPNKALCKEIIEKYLTLILDIPCQPKSGAPGNTPQFAR
jgi:hypothetical protein